MYESLLLELLIGKKFTILTLWKMRLQYLQQKRKFTRLRLKEKTALKMLLMDGRTSDAHIAQKMKISPPAARKIRKKLENIGAIEGYLVDLDYSVLGINTCAMAMIEIPESTSQNWEEKILSPNLISLYKVQKNSFTHIALFAFRDVQEIYEFFSQLAEKDNSIRVKKIYTFPLKGMRKNSSVQLFNKFVMEFGSEKR